MTPSTAVRRDEIHLWSTEIPLSAAETSILSSDEEKRRDAYRFRRDAESFALSRSFTRRVLAEYAGVPARDLTFVTDRRGKPSIAESQIRFTVSRTDRWSVLAIADERVGVDVETIRESPHLAAVAETISSERELEEMASIPDGQRLQAFFRIWTRKEAYTKAVGTGLEGDLRGIDVGAAGPSVLPNVDLPDGEWTFHEVMLDEMTLLTVASAGRPRTLVRRSRDACASRCLST
jgi:4'-phosphopantetheinyl transferase